MSLLQVIKFSNFSSEIWNYYEFFLNEKNSYQIQNIFKKFEIFTLHVYYSLYHFGIKQSYHFILKLKNQQTMVIDPKFILL